MPTLAIASEASDLSQSVGLPDIYVISINVSGLEQFQALAVDTEGRVVDTVTRWSENTARRDLVRKLLRLSR